jgi:hypothetical protein
MAFLANFAAFFFLWIFFFGELFSLENEGVEKTCVRPVWTFWIDYVKLRTI